MDAMERVDMDSLENMGSRTGGILENDYDERFFQVVPRTSELRMELQTDHFNLDGQASLTCVVTLPGLYHR